MDPPHELETFLADLAYKAPTERTGVIAKSKWKHQLYLSPHFNTDEFASISTKDTLYNLHRGTTNIKDVGTDASLALGQLQETDRFKVSDRMSQWSKFRHGQGKKVVEVGHSLGGTLAEEIAQKHHHESVAINMGTTPLKSYSGVDRTKHKHLRVKGDFVSAFDSTAQSVDSKHEKHDQERFDRRKNKRLKRGVHDWNIREVIKKHYLSSAPGHSTNLQGNG